MVVLPVLGRRGQQHALVLLLLVVAVVLLLLRQPHGLLSAAR